MAEKLLKTRIQLKYDTLANWQASELALKKGEIAIAEIETADPAKKENPPVMFKVGVDGVKTFKDLNWASALAADVYGWAKAATKPSYTPAEVGADVAGAAATAEANAKAYVDEQIGAIPPAAEYTLETGATDGSLVLKKDGVAVGDPAVVKGWAELLAKAQQGVNDAATAQAAAEAAQTAAETAQAAAETAQAAATKAQGDIDAYKTSNDAALAAVKKTADAAQTSAQVDAKISAHNSAADAHSDIRQSVTALAEKVSGRATAYVYKNKSDAAYTTAIGKAGSFVVGDTIYFTDTDILDEWVTKVNAAVPYYEFQEIETEKPSFDGYVKGTELTADKIVLGNGGSNIKASTVGVATAVAAADEANLPTNKAVADYVAAEIGKLDVEATAVGAGETIKSISETDGKITVEKQAIAIKQSQVAGLADALAGKQAAITAENKLSADLVDGLGAAARKGVAETVTAEGADLPTAKAVADYVAAQGFTKNVGTVTSVAAGVGLKVTGTASVNPTIEIDEEVEFILDCGTSAV